MAFPIPDAEALLRRAIVADALDAVGPPALRLYYAGHRVAAYNALSGRKGHSLLDELRADPLFFAQDPRPVPGWTLGTPRPFKGGTVRTRWSRIGVGKLELLRIDPDPTRWPDARPDRPRRLCRGVCLVPVALGAREPLTAALRPG